MKPMEESLSQVEEEAYEFIKLRGEVMTRQVPGNLSGAVPQLINKELVEIIKRKVSPFKEKKLKFVRIKV
jgi:hypothetical protein